MAAVAHAWAAQHAALDRHPPGQKARSAAAWAGWAALLGLLVVALPDAADVLMPGASDWSERRLARRILAAVAD